MSEQFGQKQPIMERFALRQTFVSIYALSQEHIEAAKESIREERSHLEDFIAHDPFFQLTLEPYDRPLRRAPKIVRMMAQASRPFGIGPMAAVAGAISELAAEAMMREGAAYAMVENGGDISVLNDRPVLIGIYAGSSPIRDIALKIPPRTMPLGLCTSSGTVGPSISFGFADAAVVIGKTASLADAGATALGNAVPAVGDLSGCFEAIRRPGIQGALVIRGEEMAFWGEVPEICRARVSEDKITRG